jgi:hypothetical protein
VVEGVIAPHDCDECYALRAQLTGRVWDSIPAAFLDSNDGALPLLSQDAYVAFLPAWLMRAVRDPSGPLASMMLVNLRMEPNTSGFTPEQSSVIVDVARFIVAENGYPPDDPVNVESLAAVERAWGPRAA